MDFSARVLWGAHEVGVRTALHLEVERAGEAPEGNVDSGRVGVGQLQVLLRRGRGGVDAPNVHLV